MCAPRLKPPMDLTANSPELARVSRARSARGQGLRRLVTVKRGVMMRSSAWIFIAVVLAVVCADGKEDPIKKIRRIHLASNSAKVLSEITTDTRGCVSLSTSEDPAE